MLVRSTSFLLAFVFIHICVGLLSIVGFDVLTSVGLLSIVGFDVLSLMGLLSIVGNSDHMSVELLSIVGYILGLISLNIVKGKKII